nr:MAG TPA: hypothetical protein [Caudoviricetes sp.]
MVTSVRPDSAGLGFNLSIKRPYQGHFNMEIGYESYYGCRNFAERSVHNNFHSLFPY